MMLDVSQVDEKKSEQHNSARKIAFQIRDEAQIDGN